MQNKSISDQGFINFLSNRIQARLFPLTSPNGDLNSRTKLPSAKSPVPMAATSSGWRRQASRLVGGPPDIHLGSQDDTIDTEQPAHYIHLGLRDETINTEQAAHFHKVIGVAETAPQSIEFRHNILAM